ncbi:AMP-binding enzyme [Periconia macrospinosa]|uniref:AMP-binding enzyme n=1 Tax=Periconia macrospinosa TaxID=97972 RepID=A0A2V1E7J5_9PLEO|nr:AMP-binding enzyme [Periconia macrospinosa]
MPFLAEQHLAIPTKDILSWQFEEPMMYDMDKPLYINASNPSHSISANQARTLIRQLVAGLQAAGVKRGDAVLIQSFNSIYYPIIVLGIIGAGAVYTGTNPSYTAHELDNAIQLSKTTFVITEPACLPNIRAAARHRGIPDSKMLLLDSTTADDEGEYKSWRTLLRHGEADWYAFDSLETSKSTPAMFCFSSGTTGLPKAAIVSHYNLVAQHVVAWEANPRPYRISRLIFLPMFHASTAPSTHVSPLRAGHVQVVQRRFDIATFFDHCEAFEITDLTLVPPMVTGIVGTTTLSHQQKKHKLRHLKWIIGGAAPLDAAMQACLQKLLPCPFTQVYGTTETSCIASQFTYPELDNTGSVGRFVPNVDVKLLDDDGNDITAHGVRGELAVRGPTVVEGYVGVPRERDFDDEGYFRTGDVAYGDVETAKWYIVDRKKEMIKVRGFQVAPAEVEGVLLEHQGIADAAVVGVPSPQSGSELPRAYVVKKEGCAGLTEGEVERWVEEKLAKYKRLEGGVKFVDRGGIPKTPSGKIMKRILREQAVREVGAKL